MPTATIVSQRGIHTPVVRLICDEQCDPPVEEFLYQDPVPVNEKKDDWANEDPPTTVELAEEAAFAEYCDESDPESSVLDV